MARKPNMDSKTSPFILSLLISRQITRISVNSLLVLNVLESVGPRKSSSGYVASI